MNQDEELVFEKVLNALELPEPDGVTKERIMKAVLLLVVAREIGSFYVAMPGIFLENLSYE